MKGVGKTQVVELKLSGKMRVYLLKYRFPLQDFQDGFDAARGAFPAQFNGLIDI